MALVLDSYGLMKFKKVLKAIAATNTVFNNSRGSEHNDKR